MNLQQLVLAVRNKVGEITPEFWSDTEIISEINQASRRMCSASQILQQFATFNTMQVNEGGTLQWAQEYVLPLDVDQVIGAAYFSGVVFPLMPAPREGVQLGGLVSGIPWYFYIKKFTQTLTPQNSTGITAYPIGPPGSNNDAHTVIGLYPIPNTTLPIYFWYLQWHPNMKNPQDECQVPDRFQQGIVSYAVARLKEKESAIGEAQYYDAQHQQYTQELIDWAIDNGQQITPPVYSNRPIPPYFLRGANTVLVIAQNPGTTNL